MLSRTEIDRVADEIAERLGRQPETIGVSYRAGKIELNVEDLAELLGITVSEEGTS